MALERAAQAAGVPVIITRSYYFPATESADAPAIGPSLGRTDGWRPAAEAGCERIDLKQINGGMRVAPGDIT